MRNPRRERQHQNKIDFTSCRPIRGRSRRLAVLPGCDLHRSTVGLSREMVQ